VTWSGFRFEDCRIAVGSTDVADLRWLAAFLDGSFQEVPAAPSDPHVELIVDANAYRRLFRRGRPGHAPLVEGFANDSKPVWLERWSRIGSASVFHSDRHRIFYVVAPDGAHVTILALERTPKCRTTLMRVVREFAMDRVVSTGGILVHGAAIGVPGGVVVMCGPKRSGKTTLLMAMLESAVARYIANDRCVLRREETTVSVRGLPTLVSIRRDTLERFPAARARLGRVRPDLGESELAQRPSFSVSPPVFCELMGGCPRESGGPLRALLFPRITGNPTALSVRRLDPPEALERFRAGLFRAGHASPLGQVFVSRPDGSSFSTRADHRWIAETVPSFDCQLGGDEAPGADGCRAILESVT
jgi:hypothetical protein